MLLSLVLEPEAAAVFCKYVAIRSSKDGKDAKLEVFESGSQFVIVDLGGKRFILIVGHFHLRIEYFFL